MQEIYKLILQNSENLGLVSDVKSLVLLIYMYRKEKMVKPREISDYFNLENREVSKLLSRLEDKGLVEKIDRLDKSQKPHFIERGYKINQDKYLEMFTELRSVMEECLNEAD